MQLFFFTFLLTTTLSNIVYEGDDCDSVPIALSSTTYNECDSTLDPSFGYLLCLYAPALQPPRRICIFAALLPQSKRHDSFIDSYKKTFLVGNPRKLIETSEFYENLIEKTLITELREPTAYSIKVPYLVHILHYMCKMRLGYLQSIPGDRYTQDIEELNQKLVILRPTITKTSIDQVNINYAQSIELEDSNSWRQVDSNKQELKVDFNGQDLLQGETLNIKDALKVETKFNKDGKRYRAEKTEEFKKLKAKQFEEIEENKKRKESLPLIHVVKGAESEALSVEDSDDLQPKRRRRTIKDEN